MLIDTYEHEAQRTLPPGGRLHLEMVSPAQVYEALTNFAKAAKVLDAVKKSYVYGRALPEDSPLADLATSGLQFDSPMPIADGVIHGIIGLSTEAGELAEALVDAWFNGKHLDQVNIVEEGGDLLWYITRMLTSVDSGIEEAMKGNIAKLHKRHGVTEGVDHAFNPEAATEAGRDRLGERVVMEETIRQGDVETRNRIYGDATAEKANLGLASNLELGTELEARHRMGHTDPNYRTVSQV